MSEPVPDGKPAPVGSGHWRLETDSNSIGWLCFDRQDSGANTLSAATMAELHAQLEDLAGRQLKGLVVYSGKESGFIAGADITEFPTLTSEERAFALTRQGQLILDRLEKNGLTPAEQTFFAPGTERPVMKFAGRICTTVMCREIEDIETIAVQLQDRAADLIFWPSLVGNPPGTVHPTPEDTADLGYFKRTAVLAQRLNAFVVQSNWPNALNTPDSTYLGESRVYAPDGEILLMLPRDEAGVGVFTLGERTFHWTPLPA